MGLILSEMSLLDNTITMLLYDSQKLTKDADIRILASYNLQVTNEAELLHTKIDKNGQIWAAFSNQTLILYGFEFLPGLRE